MRVPILLFTLLHNTTILRCIRESVDPEQVLQFGRNRATMLQSLRTTKLLFSKYFQKFTQSEKRFLRGVLFFLRSQIKKRIFERVNFGLTHRLCMYNFVKNDVLFCFGNIWICI